MLCTPIIHNNRQKGFLGNGSSSKFSACSYGVTRILPSSVRQLTAYSFTAERPVVSGLILMVEKYAHTLSQYCRTEVCVRVCICIVCVCVFACVCVCVKVGEILE